MHLGIDYGSKLAGTTAICYQDGKELVVIQSDKKKDADLFIQSVVDDLKPEQIFIDAPLSLPSAYFGTGEDFFYRACDRELRAMSPMFLGGLTARAMKLTRSIEKNEVKCYESYPAALVRAHDSLARSYNKKSMFNTEIVRSLEEIIGIKIKSAGNYHQIDAVICWYIGQRYMAGEANSAGDEHEGQIIY